MLYKTERNEDADRGAHPKEWNGKSMRSFRGGESICSTTPLTCI